MTRATSNQSCDYAHVGEGGGDWEAGVVDSGVATQVVVVALTKKARHRRLFVEPVQVAARSDLERGFDHDGWIGCESSSSRGYYGRRVLF